MERTGLPGSRWELRKVTSDEVPGKNVHSNVVTKKREGRWMELPRKLQVIVCYHMTHSILIARPWAARLRIEVLHQGLGSFLLR